MWTVFIRAEQLLPIITTMATPTCCSSGTGSLGENSNQSLSELRPALLSFSQYSPLQPDNLSVQQNGNKVTLRWDKAPMPKLPDG